MGLCSTNLQNLLQCSKYLKGRMEVETRILTKLISRILSCFSKYLALFAALNEPFKVKVISTFLNRKFNICMNVFVRTQEFFSCKKRARAGWALSQLLVEPLFYQGFQWIIYFIMGIVPYVCESSWKYYNLTLFEIKLLSTKYSTYFVLGTPMVLNAEQMNTHTILYYTL